MNDDTCTHICIHIVHVYIYVYTCIGFRITGIPMLFYVILVRPSCFPGQDGNLHSDPWVGQPLSPRAWAMMLTVGAEMIGEMGGVEANTMESERSSFFVFIVSCLLILLCVHMRWYVIILIYKSLLHMYIFIYCLFTCLILICVCLFGRRALGMFMS